MPIYEGRRRGTWRVTLYVGETGHKEQQEWVVEGSRNDALLFESKKRVELAAESVSRSRAVPNFVTFCTDKYEPHATTHLGADTWNTTRIYLVARLVKHFGTTKLNAITNEQAERYQRVRLSEGVRASTINYELKVLQSMLRWARRGCGYPTVELTIDKLTTDKRRVRAWTGPEVERLYAAAQEHVPAMVDLLHFMLDTGCRKGEAVAARWGWVDWDAKVLHFPVTDEWHPKDRDERQVPLSDGLHRRLKARRGPELEAIFLCQWQRPYTLFPRGLFEKMLEHAGVKGHPHMTRHTYASHFLKSQPDLALLADIMGHSTTHITERYTHLLPEHLHRARNAVELGPPSKRGARRKTVSPD